MWKSIAAVVLSLSVVGLHGVDSAVASTPTKVAPKTSTATVKPSPSTVVSSSAAKKSVLKSSSKQVVGTTSKPVPVPPKSTKQVPTATAQPVPPTKVAPSPSVRPTAKVSPSVPPTIPPKTTKSNCRQLAASPTIIISVLLAVPLVLFSRLFY